MKRLQILVVEDNPGDVFLFQEALQHHNISHDLSVLRDGQSALDYIARMGRDPAATCPDVLLLDLNLPKAEGSAVLREFRNHPDGAETPVIVVTSSDTIRDRASVAVYGSTRYFRKPSDFDEFMQLGAIVREVLPAAQD